MILCFPDFDTLRLALTTGAVPPEMSQKPAAFALDEAGRLWLQAAVEPSRAVLAELRRLGVQAARDSAVPLGEKVVCWPQLFPLQRTVAAPPLSDKAPVLFELPLAQFPELVGEMLRLGNDRQGFRYLEDGTAARVLLRVIGPPYYSLLRALDGQVEPVAYVECAPRVWVQLGYQHPLGGQFKPREGQVLLLRPPRQWTFLADGPFRDIYDIIEFQLPQAQVAWQEGKLPGRLSVPLRLGPGGSSAPAELWVLHEQPFEQLDNLVHHADDALLARLDFAVGDRGDQQLIALRVRPSKQPPPVLALQGVEFRSYLRLPNLYLPCGTLLKPPLRRDAVRRLLADDPATVTWLYPQEGGKFIPESLPDSVFRPLGDWIDYVLDHERKELELWVQSTLFDFEPFVCKDELPARPKPPPARSRAARRKLAEEQAVELPEPEAPPPPKERPRRPLPDEDDFAAVKAEPSVLQKQLRELEEQFLALQGPAEAVEQQRQALWPQLAALNAALGQADDAGVCWMHALWSQERPSSQTSRSWFETEAKAVHARQDKGQPRPHAGAGVGDADLDRLLARGEPDVADVRALAAYLVWAAGQTPPAPALAQRLNRLRLFLEAHEELIPVRAVWLAWLALARLSGGDVLVLARARDRLLERLFQSGLRPEQDLPSFLRTAGQPTSRRVVGARESVLKLHNLAQDWLRRMPDPVILTEYRPPRTAQYIELMFSFGLARLGEAEASRQLLNRAKGVLGEEDHEAHRFLLEAFDYRIRQALAGKPHAGPLPAAQMEYLVHLVKERKQLEKETDKKEPCSVDYIIDRMRWLSRILEPDQQVDPYREIKGRASPLDAALSKLPDILDRDELAERIELLLQKPPLSKDAVDLREARAQVMRMALDQAPRVGEAFAVALVEKALPLFDALPPPRDGQQFEQRAALLEKGLFVAAHFDRAELTPQLAARFELLLGLLRENDTVQSLDTLAGQCFRGLRKLGMRDVIDRLLRRMAERLLEGQELKSLSAKWAAGHIEALLALLHVAAGWFYFGRSTQAEFVLKTARALLYGDELKEPKKKTRLACAYVATLGQAPMDIAQRRIEELFAKLEGIRDSFNTGKYYGWLQLQIIEAVVLAVASENVLMGADARRWLDDDEFLIRRRIHRDVKAMMGANA